MSLIQKYLEDGINFTPAVVCFLRRGDEVLLGLRKKVSLDLGQNLLSGIGGKVGDDPETLNETCDQAIDREVLEEIGVVVTTKIKMGRVRFLYTNKPKWQFDVTIYVVDGWEEDPQETEAIKPLWFPANDLPTKQMWADNSYWVPKVLAGEQVDVVFLYDDAHEMIEHLFL